ncbi:hypothetical protein FRC14_003637 [Serendipita sp. 396]|nr:hypothetical protein FRC14_003637 [Serendipita sp. 396]KAG8783199.1 hypothetical protein FRC15_005657 [Serendipita sp. 397]KAG8798948.1 hypothetical protein FRC16_006188 [Serendipita sp. 398]KAG8825724.1 hypothetical protein FRC19_010641 [Serendipita sp. 401]KAG8867295.1 hypothetical protein FRC20_006179 [Serendipita sp. 405]KAG9056263.1 hypothetical protein FS842_011201 [Serendipita sp. 407]
MSLISSCRCSAALSRHGQLQISQIVTQRSFSATSIRMSYVGTTPIPIPPEITLERIGLDIASSESKTSGRTNDGPKSEERIIIRGNGGETSIKMYNFMRFVLPTSGEKVAAAASAGGQTERKVKRRNLPCPEDATNKPFKLVGKDPQPQVTLYVEDPSDKTQRQLWGSTRTLISNAIKGQTEGYKLPLYLIGVGYRAALELDRSSQSSSSAQAKPSTSSNDLAGERLPIVHVTMTEDLPRRRLALRLGFSHVIYLPVPPDIKVTVPSPTIISLWSRDKQLVGQFAANIRKLRPPEVYKGKGVFVGDEKIRLKVGKKK